jgi:hypothetical protein
MGKTGYLVVGPESSGTKMTAQLLRTAGCRSVAIIGCDDGPELPLDGRVPLLRRSLPHGARWIPVAEMVTLLDVDEVQAVVTTRDWVAMVDSQVARTLARDRGSALASVRRAYAEIFTTLAERSVPFVISSYEAMVSEPRYAPRLLDLIGLPAASVDTWNANDKWYGVERPLRPDETAPNAAG